MMLPCILFTLSTIHTGTLYTTTFNTNSAIKVKDIEDYISDILICILSLLQQANCNNSMHLASTFSLERANPLTLIIVTVGLVLLSLLQRSSGTFYSSYSCASKAWNISYDTYERDSSLFQAWLYKYQHTCEGAQEIEVTGGPRCGIGCSINFAVKMLMGSIELKRVYRPDGRTISAKVPGVWMYADDNTDNCTLGLRAVDCWFAPLSLCARKSNNGPIEIMNYSGIYGDIDSYKPSYAGSYYVITDKDIDDFHNKLRRINPSIDSCSMAKAIEKPLLWIHGR